MLANDYSINRFFDSKANEFYYALTFFHILDGTLKLRKTSPIVFCDATEVITESGSHYQLGEPHQEYLDFLKALNLTFNPNCPIPQAFWTKPDNVKVVD